MAAGQRQKRVTVEHAHYDAMKIVPPCMRMRECDTECYYYTECWGEVCTEEEDEDSRP